MILLTQVSLIMSVLWKKLSTIKDSFNLFEFRFKYTSEPASFHVLVRTFFL